MMKNIRVLFGITFGIMFTQVSFAQKLKILVTDIPSEGISTNSTTVGNLLRFEVEKKQVFITLDKFDVEEKLLEADFKMSAKCFGSECLIKMGKVVEVDRVLSGSINKMGERIIIALKMIDVNTGKIEKNQTNEFIDYEDELQNMLQITLNNLLGHDNNENIVQNLAHYDQFSAPVTKLKNNGPRIGVTYVGGEVADRLTDKWEYGGYDAFPVMSQIGYQLEAQYLNAGDFQALGEVLFMINGLDQQLFIPSVVLMNGFRMGAKGWEIAFGPRFGVQTVSKGYYDVEGNWRRSGENYYINGELTSTPDNISMIYRPDRRGPLTLTTGWVWAVGRTFHSGYLNIPINVYYSKTRNGWGAGLSMGFNILGKRKQVR